MNKDKSQQNPRGMGLDALLRQAPDPEPLRPERRRAIWKKMSAHLSCSGATGHAQVEEVGQRMSGPRPPAEPEFCATGNSTRKESVIMGTIHGVFSTRMRCLTSAVMVLIVVAVVVGFSPWNRDSGLAFADVLERVRNARTATWTFVVEQEDGTARTQRRMLQEPGRLRADWESGVVTILDLERKKCLTLIPQEKEFVERDMVFTPEEAEERSQYTNIIERLRALPSRAEEVLPEREMDGRTVRGFRVKPELEKVDDMVVWADVETGDPVRVERECRIGSRRFRQISADFRINVELDEALFSLTPPGDYTRSEVED